MKQLYLFIAFFSFSNYTIGQVGINTTTPNAQLEIKSSNQATPANTDGIMIPKVDAFPAINPTSAQDGMMVYLTQNIGVNLAGFYYWKSATSSWKSTVGISVETDPKITSSISNKIPKWNGTNLVDGLLFDNGTNVGIGTTNPQSKMEIVGPDNPLELKLSSTSGFGASRLSYISDKDTNNEWRPAYIESGDNATGAFWGRLDFYTNGFGAGNKFGALRAMSISNGNLGIGYTNPTDKLEVAGKTKTTNLQMTTGATVNYILQSDATGNATWVNPTTLTITESDPQVSSTTTNTIPKYNGTTLVDGVMIDNGTNIGVGIFPTAGNKLEVAGKTKTTNLQMTTGATANYVLQSDGTGNGTWVNPTSLTITETDPQVSVFTVNAIPRWIGTTLVDGVMVDNGNNVGIGTTPTAGNKLEVAGKTLTSILEVTNKTTTDRFRMISGAVDKYVLQSDPNGNTTWVNPNTLIINETDPQVSSATTNTIPKYNGTTLVDGIIVDNGTNVGIGTTPTSGNKLEVAGKTKTTNLQLTTGATSNYVLQSDATGNATWVNNNGGYTHYLGELYLGGVIFELHKEADGLEHGLIASLTESLPLAWQSTVTQTNSTRTWDGVYNTNLMTDSPVKTYIESLGIGWYLPSVDEINILFNNSFYVNKTLYESGNTILNNTFVYWTSNEYEIYSGTYAYSKFPSGYPGLSPRIKTAPAYTRAIRSF